MRRSWSEWFRDRADAQRDKPSPMGFDTQRGVEPKCAPETKQGRG